MASEQVHTGVSKGLYQVQFGTSATMNNTTPSSLMTLDRSYNWFGSPSTGSFPANIPHNANSKFVHIREGQFGSMAAVQYSGPQAPGGQGGACAWILAWLAPADDSTTLPNRVYVACGSKDRMDEITWDQIMLNLEQSSTKSEAHDSWSKTTVDATIDDSVPKTATLTSNFGYMN